MNLLRRLREIFDQPDFSALSLGHGPALLNACDNIRADGRRGTMIRTMLMLRVDPAKVDDVIDYYRRRDVLQFSLDHSDAVASEISVAADGSGDILVTALWPDSAAYQDWIDNPWRASSNLELAELLRDAEVGSGRIFEIDHDVRKP